MAKKIYETEKSYKFNISQLSEIYGMDRKTIRRRLNYAGVKPGLNASGAKLYTLLDASIAIMSFEKQTQELVYRIHGR